MASPELTASEARNRRIPLRKHKYGPSGPDLNLCFPEALQAWEATLQDNAMVDSDRPPAVALLSSAPAGLDARQPEVHFDYMCADAI